MLSRETSGGSFIPELDGLRFIAIISVLVFHIYWMCRIAQPKKDHGFDILTKLFENGGRAVPLFFCISGFILGMPFAKQWISGGKKVNVKAYFTRRLTRLEPPYLANLLIRAPFVLMAKHIGLRQALPHLLASFFYIHTLVYATTPLFHGASWSLEIEAQFYLLAPLAALLLFRISPQARRVGVPIFVLIATIIQWRLGWAEDNNGTIPVEFTLLNFGQFFLMGFLVADLYVSNSGADRQLKVLDIVGVLALLAFFYVPSPVSRMTMPFLSFAVLWCGLNSNLFKSFLRKPIVYTIGGMCYSLYLTHQLVLQGIFAVLAKVYRTHAFIPFYVVSCIICIPIVLAIASIFFILLERPCMNKEWPQQLKAKLFGSRAKA